MAVNIDQKKCVGCGLCIEVCPTHALFSLKGKATLNPVKCDNCGVCDRMCIVSALVFRV